MNAMKVLTYFILLMLVSCINNNSSEELSTKKLFIKADSFYECHKYDIALKYYRLINQCDTCTGFYFRRGNCYAAISKHKDAIHDFQKAINENFRLADCYFNIACCYGAMDSFHLAHKYFKKVLEINPNDSMAKEEIFILENINNIK